MMDINHRKLNLKPHSSDTAKRAKAFLKERSAFSGKAENAPIDNVLKERAEYLRQFIEARNESRNEHSQDL
ncbi:hypothetical protein DVB69_13865 [Sporosarcina sp. BI001-red]|uniref:hypothetical protein n=1 Tax=Sporosarcina sp. BI001-red TaxID=2282866 RepID=UPI000E244D56|nr:hypothetical protein [Sporosarcina sp. BI001-red]REB06019.1 hypothetical protein DVB69_13865 [Sporosarcina sp. BI001-red]